MVLLSLVAVGAAVVLGLRFWSVRKPTQVSVEPRMRHQTIDGWAVYPRYWEDDKQNDRFDRSFERYTAQVSEALVRDVGINAVRVEIWSGLENPRDHFREHYEGRTGYKAYANVRYEKINDDSDSRHADLRGFQFSKFDHRVEHMVLPLLRALEKRGEKAFINVCYVDFKWNEQNRQGTLSHAAQPDEFAEFVLVFFQRLRGKYGVVPDAFEVILEPENTEAWRGAEIGRALVAVHERLAEAGFRPRLVAPSNTSMRNAIQYFDEMVRVPRALRLLDTFAYHRYHLELTSDVDAIWQRARASGKKTGMLEKVGAGIDVLFEDLTVGNVSGWQQWAAADRAGSPDKGGYYVVVDDSVPERPKVSLAERSHLLSQVFRYVRRGAVRVGAASDNDDKSAVAFVNPDGQHVLVVRAREAGGEVTVRGLPAGTYGARFVGDDRRVEAMPPSVARDGEAVTLTLPASGAVTLYGMVAGR